MPVELVGTAFQQRVWQALMRIPPGQTRSYAEIAAELGQPRAVRAVARDGSLHEIAATIFLFITAPVSAHLLAKAALHIAQKPDSAEAQSGNEQSARD